MKILNQSEFKCPAALFIKTRHIKIAAMVLERHIRDACKIRLQDFFEIHIEEDLITVNRITGEYVYQFSETNSGESEVWLLRYTSFKIISR